MRKDAHTLIRTARITEKSTALSGEDRKNRRYTFEVDRKATKQEIRQAVGKIFGVKILGVNTLNVKAKVKRSRMRRNVSKGRNWKKAIVTLAEGEKIDLV